MNFAERRLKSLNVTIIGLTIVLILVLLLPFTVKIVEENLEPFLFLMGLAAAFIKSGS